MKSTNKKWASLSLEQKIANVKQTIQQVRFRLKEGELLLSYTKKGSRQYKVFKAKLDKSRKELDEAEQELREVEQTQKARELLEK